MSVVAFDRYNSTMQTMRWIIAASIFLALLFLSLQNSEPATLKFFQFASWQAPLVVVVFIAFAAGVASGLLAGALRAARLKRQLNRLRRELRGGADTREPDAGATARHVASGTSTDAGPGFHRQDRPPGDA
jgi:putative membrane protein